jgi:hypothetical protein
VSANADAFKANTGCFGKNSLCLSPAPAIQSEGQGKKEQDDPHCPTPVFFHSVHIFPSKSSNFQGSADILLIISQKQLRTRDRSDILPENTSFSL